MPKITPLETETERVAIKHDGPGLFPNCLPRRHGNDDAPLFEGVRDRIFDPGVRRRRRRRGWRRLGAVVQRRRLVGVVQVCPRVLREELRPQGIPSSLIIHPITLLILIMIQGSPLRVTQL